MPNSLYITGLFDDRLQAEKAYQDLLERGYAADEISLVMSEETKRREFARPPTTELGHKAAEGAGLGGAIGGTLGAVAAAMAALGTTLVIPAMGLALAGPVAAAFAGAGAGAATGGLVGALIGWGIPEERVRRYENELQQGGILLGVRAHSLSDYHLLEGAWRRNAELPLLA